MTLDLQYKIKENEYYLRHLRQNSNWYKLLNRNPANFKAFEEEVRTVYKLTKADKISRTLDTIEMLEKVLSTLR
ncbi:MAG: hypothetical protein HFH47_03575 [Bacilli bacterium]|nr:hypothetical protein [Bacilli bacterium]